MKYCSHTAILQKGNNSMETEKVKSWLRTQGRIIVDEDGDEILLRGVGTGNWMNPEGFLMGAMRFGADMGPFMRAHPFDRGRTMETAVAEICGEEYAKEFMPKWMRANISEKDLACFKKLGFNSIRLALSARLFLKEGPGIYFNEENFAYLDEMIDLCEKHGLYVILDMHAACGGQSGVSCDDGYANVPLMFMSEEDQERTMILWEKMAEKYRDRWIVAGYELLNEPIALPVWDHLIDQLKSFYEQCVRRIRAIDQRHIIFIQGNRFAGRYEIFDRDYDPVYHNWVMTVHLYEKLPDLSVFGPMLERSEALDIPVWIGETGGSTHDESNDGNLWMSVTYEMALEYHMGINIWVNKAIDNDCAAYILGFRNPDNWKVITDYFYEGGRKPSYQEAISILDEWLENVRFENCTVRYDRVNHILRKGSFEIPAIGYDPEHEHAGTWTYALYNGYRREDRMHLVYEDEYRYADLGGLNNLRKDKTKYGDFAHMHVLLEEGDCVSYTFRDPEKSLLVKAEYKADDNFELVITVDGEMGTDRQFLKAGRFVSDELVRLEAGVHTVTIRAEKGSCILKRIISEE